MTTLLVTGASGQLGRLIVEALLDRGIDAADIVATARTVENASDLADRGVTVRPADYNDPAALKEAFAGVDRAVLVSSSAVGQRVEQHSNVIEAAREAGVGLLAYTSILGADRSTLALADDHRKTEQLLAESDLPYVLLRNSWYLENYTAQIGSVLAQGVVLGSAGAGRISAASRADYALAAAAVLTGGGHAGHAYELGGSEPFTLDDYADVVAAATAREVVYQELSSEDHVAALVGAGIPEPFALILADTDRGIRAGELFTTSTELEQLIGRPTTSLAEAVRSALS